MGFVDNIKTKVTAYAQVIGLEVEKQPSSQIFRWIHLKKEKDQIEIVGQGQTDVLDQLNQAWPDELPIVLTISGLGVIQKAVMQEGPLNQLLPGADAKDFALAYHGEKKGIAAAIRIDKMEEVLADVKSIGHVVDVQLGVSGLCLAKPVFANQSNFKTGTQLLSFENNELVALGPTTEAETVTLGADQIAGDMLSAFGGAIALLLGMPPVVPVSHNVVDQAIEDFQYGRRIKPVGWGILISLLVLLLANFLVFDHFQKQLTTLSDQSLEQRAKQRQVEELDKQLAERRSVLEFVGLESASKTSYYADRLASSLPSGIKLTGLNAFPIRRALSQLDDDELPAFKEGEIVVSGRSSKSLELNNWIEKVKRQDWVENVHILDVQEDKSKSKGEFTVAIQLMR